MKRFVLALLAIFIVVPGGFAQPQSGYIRHMGYRIDQKGKRSQPSVTSEIWFTPTRTRKEFYESNALTHVSVDGDRRWSAYPRIERFQRHDPTPWGFRSYPEQVKWFAERFAELKPIGRDTLIGYPCYKYSWHVKKEDSGCVRIPEHDDTCWAYIDNQFPVSMRYETTLGSGTEISEMKLNCEVSTELFQEPNNFTIIAPLKIPTNAFVVRITERRSSPKYEWSEKIKHEFVRENETIHYSSEKTTTDSHGKESVQSSERDLCAKEALAALSIHLSQPYWAGVVSEGRERWKGMTVDIYVPDSMRQALGMKWWVLNHPQFGTITVKKTEVAQNRVIEVERLFINDSIEADKKVEQTDEPSKK
jgi:hypothetical protein